MCLILTATAAVAATLVWYFKAHEPALKLGSLALMYWGASLMWLVDGFFALAEGEPFLEISVSDAVLGCVVVLCGVAVWALYLLIRDPKQVFLQLRQKQSDAGTATG